MTSHGYSPAAAAAEHSPSPWSAPPAAGPLHATLALPGSKSLTGRELVLAALAEGPSRLTAPLHSQDSARMIEALTALGVRVDEVEGTGRYGGDLVVTPPTTLAGSTTIDCGQAGTVMRFVTPLAGFARGDVEFTAHASALHRPMGEMVHALREVGVDVDDGGRWALPFTVRGRGHVRGGEVHIDASRSSQFVSGLLLAAARFDVGIHLMHTGDRLPSIPHIDMTIECLAHRGAHVEKPAPNEWVLAPGPLRAKDIAIEPDLSNAAPFLAAAMVAGGSVSVTGWPAHSTQPGALLTDILHRAGARLSRTPEALTLTGDGVRAFDIDLSAAGELAPTLVGLAALADGPSTVTGIGHIRLHETDRIRALVDGINALGGDARELPDGIRVVPRPLSGGLWRSHHDHRMATTGALIGLAVPGVQIDDLGVTAKTLPQFEQLWNEMLEGTGERL
ncbi:3-phosphoshikimate 1-carboxyvinyltransferase [Microbacterium sp. LRZ72]|uniref:3-phosphoshikimate 1-carboxyvinyltransferase n=1 Tax=Microbacterium sp. LRZ72 TaxID=2942481 RepID=UPI0029A28FB2|nr:3-phosphoshikimate 1-carboxyvinyltransferase [Microbacterium sp. LRZ72]MDX2377074.1 3-phosphoshikimate 1-carboxyvinyltransferase [Microbacterium sp. LRZ72]